jgi:hypothetical protein
MKDFIDSKNAPMARFLDELSLNLHGRSRTLAIVNDSCVSCGGRADKFKDEVSKREFGISGLCQKCQDEIWK